MQIQGTDYQKRFVRYRKYYSQRINPFLKSRHATAYTMVVLSIFTISFFGFFAIRPTVKTIVELKRQIEDNQIVDKALQKKIDDLVIAQEEYQLIKDFVPAINEALPDTPNLTQALVKIESLASSQQASVSAMQVQSVTFQPGNIDTSKKEISNKPTTIDIAIKVSGNYKQLDAFLDKLFKTRRTITAQNLELLPETSETATLKLVLKLNTYYLK